MRKMRALLLAAAGLLIALTTPAAAQSDYPNRPIRLIIPFPAGRQQRHRRPRHRARSWASGSASRSSSTTAPAPAA